MYVLNLKDFGATLGLNRVGYANGSLLPNSSAFVLQVKFPVYEVAVDLCSNTIAMDYPFPDPTDWTSKEEGAIGGFKQALDVWKWIVHGNRVGP